MNLSNNFTLEEMLHSNTADAMGFKEQYTPDEEVINNLKLLVENVLQPIRNIYKKPITVNCAYRCERVNNAVKGVKNSQHLTGQAADITCDDNKLLFDTIRLSGIKFDQLIDEKHYSWLHISYNNAGNRKQILHLT